MTSKTDTIQVDEMTALPYSMSLALHEYVNRGVLTNEEAEAIQARVEEVYNALMDGKTLMRQANGLYRIEDNDLTIGG